MARAKFNPGEVDPNFQIEDAIRETLRSHLTAEASLTVIESNYDLLDESFELIDGTVDEKCQAIANSVGARYSLQGTAVAFAKI